MRNPVLYFLSLFFFVLGCNNLTNPPRRHLPVERITTSLSDSALLDIVQKQTFKYFWDFAHPTSGMARERSNESFHYGSEVVTTGGTGFGIMSVIVAAERNWVSRDEASKFLLKLVTFLEKSDSYHGVYPHWMNGETGKTIPFSKFDDGADLVETSYLFQGLLCARQYFSESNETETQLRNKINEQWNKIEWSWFTQNGQSVLYWHWSPKNDWKMNLPIHGFNECLIVYVLAASADHYPVSDSVYHFGWTQSSYFNNGKTFYGIELPLGFDFGGPLFFSHYSFLGLDPHGLKDRYADYWKQNQNHTLINREHAIRNPNKFKGYSADSWGMTASDVKDGYAANSPTEDNGTITPSAALSAFPYTPEFSMKALKHFYYSKGNEIWSDYGFVDSFNESEDWVADSYLAIDQGPIIVMIENYRSGLLWKLFMSCPEIQNGLRKLDFESPWLK